MSLAGGKEWLSDVSPTKRFPEYDPSIEEICVVDNHSRVEPHRWAVAKDGVESNKRSEELRVQRRLHQDKATPAVVFKSRPERGVSRLRWSVEYLF